MENKEFKKKFLENIDNILSKEGYRYTKSKSLFKKKIDNHVYYIFIYFYFRSNFIEVETKCYYDNTYVHNQQKVIAKDEDPQPICGGTPKFICEYYFQQKYLSEYTNLIYNKSDSIEASIQFWNIDYERYIKPFFEDCSSFDKLNDIVNGENMDITGLNLSYSNRILKSMFVANLSGLTIDCLKQLANEYDVHITQYNTPVKTKYELIKSYFFDNCNQCLTLT